jgi:hypothetical protein
VGLPSCAGPPITSRLKVPTTPRRHDAESALALGERFFSPRAITRRPEVLDGADRSVAADALGLVEPDHEPDDVADLVGEVRILGRLPGLGLVRGQPERPRHPRDRGLRHPRCAAIDRVDQCVAVFGADSKVSVISFSTSASEIERGPVRAGLVDQVGQSVRPPAWP